MKYSFCLIYTVLIIACSSKQGNRNTGTPESPDIQFTLQGLNGGTAYLYGTYMDQQLLADSATVDGSGQILFRREKPYPAGQYFLAIPGMPPVQLLITDDQTMHFHTTVTDPVGSMQVEGSLDNSLLYRDLVFGIEIQPRMLSINQRLKITDRNSAEYLRINDELTVLLEEQKAHEERILEEHPETFFATFKKASRNPPITDVRKPDGSVDNEKKVILFRNQYWDEVDFSDNRLLRTNLIAKKLNTYMTQLTIQRADSINRSAGALLDRVLNYPEYYAYFIDRITYTYDVTRTDIMDPDAVFHYIVTNYVTYEKATWLDSAEIHALRIRAADMANSLVGLKGPDIQAKDPSGHLRSISEIKDPYAIVFIYDPTCDHCIEETPKLLRFYREWKSKGVEVFALAFQTDENQWREFIRKNQTHPWLNVLDTTNQVLYRTYYVDKTPEIYILDPDRTIIAKNLKVEQIAQVLTRDAGREQSHN